MKETHLFREKIAATPALECSETSLCVHVGSADGVAFPFVWIMLYKKGNSNTHERCELWNRFLEIFADRKINFLTTHREFVGDDWFDYLLCDPRTPFRIRIRKSTLIDDALPEPSNSEQKHWLFKDPYCSYSQ